MKPVETIAAFDSFLAQRGYAFDAVVVGGAALSLLGVVSRQTRDCDILCPKLPESIQDAEETSPWLEVQDSNPEWPFHTRATIDDLKRRLGHGV